MIYTNLSFGRPNYVGSSSTEHCSHCSRLVTENYGRSVYVRHVFTYDKMMSHNFLSK